MSVTVTEKRFREQGVSLGVVYKLVFTAGTTVATLANAPIDFIDCQKTAFDVATTIDLDVSTPGQIGVTVNANDTIFVRAIGIF